MGIFEEEGVLDEPAPGRDVLDLFVVVLDRGRDLVALLDAEEPYTIGTQLAAGDEVPLALVTLSEDMESGTKVRFPSPAPPNQS